MATGYTRQAAAQIAPNLVILSNSFNLEFNKLQDAMNESSGHNHDGTVGGGAPITGLGLGLAGATGFVIAASAGAFSTVVLTCTNSSISITNPGGQAGNPILNVNTGVTALSVVQLDSLARLPAVDGSQLTNLGSVSTDASNTVYAWEYFI